MLTVMDREMVREVAPSIFADHGASRVSSAYECFPTSVIMDKMVENGWLPVYAGQQKVRVPERAGFQKHLIRFRQEKDCVAVMKAVLSEAMDIVLTNSHDGLSSNSITAGIFRCVCINGTISGSTAHTMKVMHMGTKPEDVLNASFEVVKKAPALMEAVEKMRAKTLTPEEQLEFAKRSYLLKFDEKPVVKKEIINGHEYKSVSTVFDPKELLLSRRNADNDGTLWTVFNKVQENLIKGMPFRIRTNNGRKHIRAVSGLTENIRINKSLWNIADHFIEGGVN